MRKEESGYSAIKGSMREETVLHFDVHDHTLTAILYHCLQEVTTEEAWVKSSWDL